MRIEMPIKKPQARKVVKKVVKGLKKASKTHASQAKSLSALKLNKGGSTCLLYTSDAADE